MIKQLVLALFLGSTQAVNLNAYNQLIKAAGQTVPPELGGAPVEKAKEVAADSAEAGATAASTAAVAEAATVAATSAAARADPYLTLGSGLNAPLVIRKDVIIDPKIIAENQAVKEAVQAAKDRVAAEPKIKA
jgi:hypothetical protein